MAIKNIISRDNLSSRSFDVGVVEPNKINVKTDNSLRVTANGLSAHLLRIIATATAVIPLTAQVVSVNNGATNITLTLPTGASAGQVIWIKRLNNTSTGTITINGGGAQVEAESGTFGVTTTIGVTATTRRTAFIWNGASWERLI